MDAIVGSIHAGPDLVSVRDVRGLVELAERDGWPEDLEVRFVTQAMSVGRLRAAWARSSAGAIDVRLAPEGR